MRQNPAGKIARAISSIWLCLVLAFGSTSISGAAGTAGKPRPIPAPAAATTVNLVLRYAPLITLDGRFGPGNLTGTVKDAISRSGISGVNVCWTNKLGQPVCTLTLSDGVYSLNSLDSGVQRVTAQSNTWLSASKDVLVNAYQTRSQVDFYMFPDLSASDLQYRFIMTWNERPIWPPTPQMTECIQNQHTPPYTGCLLNDLDSQLWLDDNQDPKTHLGINFSQDRLKCSNVYPYACWEMDIQAGAGPESMAIKTVRPEWENRMYYYGVFNVNAGGAGVGTLQDDQPIVQVYYVNQPGEPIQTYRIPSTGAGDLWLVFKMDYRGVITPLNCIVNFYSGTLDEIRPQCPGS
jgi:hypothetical protein